METFLASIASLEKSILDEVNFLAQETHNQQIEQSLDRIRLNLSSHLCEIRTIIVDKVRLRQVTLDAENQFHTVDGCIVVTMYGVVNNPSTSRASGAYAIVWNRQHKMNICFKNVLTIKSASSSYTLGLLALVTQMEVLDIKKVVLVTTSAFVKTIIQQLPIWAARHFLMEDNTVMHNHRTLSKINDTISLNSLKLEVLQIINLTSPLRELCNDLIEVAKRDIVVRVREIRAEL